MTPDEIEGESFGAWVKDELEKRNMNMRQLSVKAGIPYSTVYSIITRTCCTPSYENVTKITDFFNSKDQIKRSKSRITLCQLLDVIDPHRESEIEKIQICRPNENWEDFDEVLSCSSLLVPLYNAEITELSAIGEATIRVNIDWPHLKWKNTTREELKNE